MTPSRGAVLVAAAFALASAPAVAEPSFWKRLAAPNAEAETEVLPVVERVLDDARIDDVEAAGLDRELARTAVVMLELRGLVEPKDPQLACLAARALLEAEIGREADARRLLERALERLPPGTRAASAWNLLAIALGRLDDAKAQHRAYSKVIELTWDPQTRALAFYNRGETSMQLHDLSAARSDYEQAILGGRDPSMVALARYGLAVAEERLGDLPAAYAALDKAIVVRLPVPPFPSDDPLDLPSVFFVPPYEENYIRALRAMAVGRRASEPTERRDAYETAVVEWDSYLARAADDDPYRDAVRQHRARAERALEQAREVERRGPARSGAARRPPANQR